MVEALKNFGVGISVIIAVVWAFYGLLFGIISLFSLGQYTFAVMPVWSWVLAGIPWAALVAVIVASIGEDVRNTR